MNVCNGNYVQGISYLTGVQDLWVEAQIEQFYISGISHL